MSDNIFNEINDAGYLDNDVSYLTEATLINSLPYMKTITKRFDLPIGHPTGRGNLCFLYTKNPDESIKIMGDKTHFRNITRYRLYYYDRLYMSRIYTKHVHLNLTKEREALYKKVKSSLGLTPIMRLESSHDNRNMFYDLSKHMEIFRDICYKLQPRSYIKFYWDYLSSLIMKDYPGFQNKFVLIDLTNYQFYKNDMRKNLENPLYVIYYTLFKSPELLSLIDIDFIFYSGKKVLRVNPSKVDTKKGYKLLQVCIRKISPGLYAKDVVDTITDDNNLQEDEIETTATARITKAVTPVNEIDEPIESSEQLKMLAKPTEIEKRIDKDVKKRRNHTVSNVLHATQKVEISKSPKVKKELTPEKRRSNDTLSNDISKVIEVSVKKDIDKDRDMLNKIYRQNMSSAEKQKSAASTARDKMLQKEQKKLKIDDMSIDQIEKINAQKIPIAVQDVSNSVKTMNKNMTKVKFDNIDKEYNDKLMQKDIVSSVLALNNKSIPMYILKIEKKDTSDELNYKDTYTIYLEDGNRKRHTVNVDIPKFIDGHFMYLGGNKKIIKHESFLLPIVKMSANSVQIVSNYSSKLTVTRVDSKSTSAVERLKKIINKHGDLASHFTVGTAFPNNKEYLTTLEYDALSHIYISYKSAKGNTFIIFDQELAKSYMEKHKIAPIENKIFIGLSNNKPCFIDANTQEDDKGRGIVSIIVDSFDKKYQDEFSTTEAPKRLIYANIRIMKQNMYVAMLLGLWVGLSDVLRRLKVTYRIEKTAPRILGENENFIRFSDGVMVYTCDVPTSFILNSLKLFNTKDYALADFDDKLPYLDYIKKVFGSAIKENALMNFYEFFMDPITIEICESMNLPTNIVDVIIYAVKLLADTQAQNELDMNLYRIRCDEVIPGILYDKLAREYVNYRVSNGKKKFSIPRDVVIKTLLGLKNVEDYSTLNPTLEMQQLHAVSNKGYVGINLDDYYTIERRSYDPTMIGILSPSGSPDGQIGINKTLTLEPEIKNLRGIIEDDHKHLDKLRDVNLFGPGELTMPMAATIDDPNRLGHANKQSSHVIPVKVSSPVLISNGMEEVARFHLTSNFCINAQEDGEIVDYDKSSNILIAKYKSGKCQAIDLTPNIVKNSGGGFYLSNKLITPYKVGDKFKKNDVLAYHKDFFTNDKFNNCRMNMGPLTKIAIMSTYNTYEDATFITHKLSEECATEMVFSKSAVVGKNANVFSIVKVGQEIEVGDPLIVFDTSYEDDSINTLLANLAENDKASILEDARNEVKSKYSGVIEDIRIYSTVELEEMSPSLKKIVSSYYNKINKKNAFLNKYDPDDKHSIVKCGILVNTPAHKIKPNKFGVIRGEYVEDSVLFEFYVKHSEPLEVGSKIANFTALKNTIGEIIPEGYEPYSEYRPKEEISTFIASNSILKRMTPSILLTALGNKCVIELKRHLKDLFPDRKRMEALIYKFFTAIDPSGSNTKHYKGTFYSYE